MTWVRIDDRALLHPKLLAAGPDGVTLWLAGLCYCNAHHTDGTIPTRALAALYPSDEWTKARQTRAAARLVELGAWHQSDAGWTVHGYAEYQEEALRKNVDERRAYERERKRAQREAKRAQREAKEPAHLDPLSRRDSPGLSTGTSPGQVRDMSQGQRTGQVRDEKRGPASDVSQPPDPSRPVPTRPLSSTERHVDGLSAPSPEPRSRASRAEVLRVFEHWRATFKKNGATKLDRKRAERIGWALEAYGLAAVLKCIDGYALSPHHRGHNERGVRYEDLELFLRDAKHVEAGVDFADNPPKPKGGRLPPSRIDPESAAESARAAAEIFGGGPLGEVANG